MAEKAYSLSHTKWMCKYHIVFTPQHSVASVMGYLKGRASLMIFDRHANMKYKFGNRKFWSAGCCVSTVGLNEATIAEYIRGQEKTDIALGRLSVKEYEDPFSRGARTKV